METYHGVNYGTEFTMLYDRCQKILQIIYPTKFTLPGQGTLREVIDKYATTRNIFFPKGVGAELFQPQMIKIN